MRCARAWADGAKHVQTLARAEGPTNATVHLTCQPLRHADAMAAVGCHASRLLKTQCSQSHSSTNLWRLLARKCRTTQLRMGDTVTRTIAIYGIKLQMNSPGYTRFVTCQHGLLPWRRVQVDACVRALWCTLFGSRDRAC